MRSTKNFGAHEFRCSCGCGDKAPMGTDLLRKLQKLRDKVGPINLTSAYRCAKHPIEAKKRSPGTHNKGIAVDIAVTSSSHAYIILKEAYALGFTGIAHGNGFVHVDTRRTTPVTWKY